MLSSAIKQIQFDKEISSQAEEIQLSHPCSYQRKMLESNPTISNLNGLENQKYIYLHYCPNVHFVILCINISRGKPQCEVNYKQKTNTALSSFKLETYHIPHICIIISQPHKMIAIHSFCSQSTRLYPCNKNASTHMHIHQRQWSH